ncbi:response regulator [Calothrix sp. FACHB-1219]|uniref:response regulator n=1 Tax=unclassified Calothrix TaxID=2619626 RepID=UPI001685C202|nr:MULTISPECIES: response regulator [unclassified Calothrix]MBD2205884.1 response regulator [Calothrix sp. FACHB-168]MBD2220713.1 response regulator [Calothrix sp. FACHB-1219]
MKILVVEDDELLAAVLREILNTQNYAVELASDGIAGKDLIETYDYDLILLDVLLPKLDGISLCRHIRSRGLQMPVLLLTGCDSSHEKAIGLDAGADDYVVKPFDQEELVARVRALLRRGGKTTQPVLEWGNLHLDPSSCEVSYNGELLSLTPKEYALLELFLRNNRRVFSCGMILEHLWSYEDTPGEEAVRTHIKGLRMKLRNAGAPSDFVETVYGIGYRLKPQAVEEPYKSELERSKANQPSQKTQQQTIAAVAEIWQRFQERVREQVGVIEQAAAVNYKSLSPELRQQATQEAHTLAGSLATFGLPLGSKLARKIEQLLKSDKTLTQSDTSKLKTWVQQLRQEIESKQQETEPEAATTADDRALVLVVDKEQSLVANLTAESANSNVKFTNTTNIENAQHIIYRDRPSVVLLDPSVSANQEASLNLLAELSRQQPPIPVLVLTEQSDFSNRLQLARNGGHTFLQKPMPAAQVLEAITQVLQQAPLTEAKILAVDDDPKILALLQTLLSPWGLKVIGLEDPRQFWTTLQTVSPDLLILDVQMPHTNGIEICKVVRNDSRWSELPILFLTVHSDAEIVNQVFSVGADDFVRKPIVGPELVTRILNRLERIKLLRRVTNSRSFDEGRRHTSTSLSVQEVDGRREELREGRREVLGKGHTLSAVEESRSHSEVEEIPSALSHPKPDNRWQAIFEAEPECVKIIAVDGTLLEINPAGILMLEAESSEALIGKSVYSLLAPEYAVAFRSFHHSICQGNKGTLQFEIVTCKGNRRWMETHGVPLPCETEGKCEVAGEMLNLAITRDITEYRKAETEIRRVNRTLQALTNCSQVLVRAKDELELLQRICQMIVEVGGYRLAWVGFAEDDAQKTICPVAQAGYEAGYLQSLNLTWADTVEGRVPAGTAIRTRQTTIIQNILTNPDFEVWRCQATKQGYASAIALPLITDNQAFGVLLIYAAEPDSFDSDEVQLLEALATDVAYGIMALRNQRDRQLAQIALQQSQRSYQQLVELCPEAIFIERDGYFIFANSAAVKMFGAKAPTELVGKPILDFVHPYSQEAMRESFHLLKEYKQEIPLHEAQFVQLDGNAIALEIAAAPCTYQNQDASQFIVRDITKHKQTEEFLHKTNSELELRVAERTAELISLNRKLQSELDERQKIQEQLRISQAKFARILDIADDAIISIDSQQKITLFNQGAEKIFGYTAQDAIGQPLDLLLPLRFAQAHRHHVADFGTSPNLARRMGERREIFGRRRDGTEFPAEASISKLAHGDEVYYTVILRDITERKQIERMKDEFVSVVSHELRTPLTSIHGSLGMLTSGLLPPTSEQGKRLLQIATDSTDRLVRLINDILDIERIESGRVKMEREVCNIADLIESAVNIMQPLAERAGVKLSISSLSLELWIDPDRIVQTLTNLLSNAIKFSPPGATVWLVATQEENEVMFTVKDTGRGIPEDKLDSIFERFQQVDSSDSRNHDGTGLGLAICQSIVQQHGGKIWVESTLEQGSTFYFAIPIERSPETSETFPPHQHSEAINHYAPLVLVCDDDPFISKELQKLLETGGYRVVTVTTGEEAIALAASQHPDVILLDLLMPGMNGWETMAVLKERPDTKDIPIVICSVYKPSVNSQSNVDFADWVSKPVPENYLLQSLRQVVAKSSKRVRILIVEDDRDLAQLLITLLERHDIETFLAQTGREAIHLSQQVNPDLLILDLILPESDGFAVVDWLKKHNQLCSTPVVVYSAKDLDESERNRLKLGHTEFLTKGRVTTQEFEHRVMELLQRMTKNQQEGGSNDTEANSRG